MRTLFRSTSRNISITAILVSISVISLRADEVHFIGTNSGELADRTNWAGGQLPGPNDVAIIDIEGEVRDLTFDVPIVLHVSKIIGRERLEIDGGTLKIDEELDWGGDQFWLQSGGNLEVPKINLSSGSIRINGSFSALEEIDISGGSIDLRNGDYSQLAKINNAENHSIALSHLSGKSIDISSLPFVGAMSINRINLHGGSLTWNNPTEITGLRLLMDAESHVELSQLAKVNDFDFSIAVGQVEFSSLAEIGGENQSRFLALSVGAQIEFPSLTTLTNSATLTMRTQNSGRITLPRLEVISTPVRLETIHADSRINLPALTRFAGGSISHFDGVIEFSDDVTRLEDVDVFVDLHASIEAGTLELVGGSLSALGTIAADTINISGAIIPGWRGSDRTRSMTIAGDYQQLQDAAFHVNVEGLTPGENADQLVIEGQSDLDGHLSISTFDFGPELGDTVTVLKANAINGRFRTVSGVRIDTFMGLYVDYGETEVSLRATMIGDVNLDDRFDSGDLVRVFQIGEYEDGIPQNSDWIAGDWNGDSEFDSGDLVAAFQGGKYEVGQNALTAVPEPSPAILCVLGLTCIVVDCRRRTVR